MVSPKLHPSEYVYVAPDMEPASGDAAVRDTRDLTEPWAVGVLCSNHSQLSGESESYPSFPVGAPISLLSPARTTQTGRFAYRLQISSPPKCKTQM